MVVQNQLLQLSDPTLERSFRGHKDVVTSLSFKPSMTQLASASMDNSVMIWNFKPQLRAFRFVGHKAPVTCVDFSPSGNLLASASRDKTVRLWTPSVKGDVTVFKAHTSNVRCVQFSKDGEQLLTASDDKTVKIWSAARTKFQYTLAGHLNWVRTAQFSPDSKLVVSGSDDKTVKLWDLNSKMCVKTYWDHAGMVTSVAFHPSGTIIATASTDRSIKLFDIRMHRLIQHYGDAHGGLVGSNLENNPLNGVGSGGGVNSVAFGGTNGDWLVSTGMDGVVKIWDLKEGHLFYTLHGHKNGPTTAAVFSPEGDFFATAGSDSQVMVWKTNFDEPLKLRQNLAVHPHAFEHSHHHIDECPPVPHHHVHNNLHAEPSMNPPRVSSPIMGTTETPPPHHGQFTATHNRGDLSPKASPVRQPKSPKRHQEQPQQQQQQQQQQHQQRRIPKIIDVEPQSLSNQLTGTLSTIVKQMDVLTKTMEILESRLTLNEDRVLDFGSKVGLILDKLSNLDKK